MEIFYFHKQLRRCRRGGAAPLRAAGLDSLPGGGAEIFAPRVRKKICDDKCTADEWLDVHRTAHRMGLRSNCTMLYGTIETVEERVDHMLRLRALQDETGGFQTFIPLAFHPDNNALMKLPGPTGVDDLRTYAVARLMLDNIPHIKAYWIMLGVKTAQTALWFGADDLDGTVQEEKIYHMAGAETPQAMTPAEIVRLIREAGRTPVERDTLYNVVAEGAALALRQAVPARRAPRPGGGVVKRKLRIAAVSFLNARPITYGLERGLGIGERFDLSLRAAGPLRRRCSRAGEVDLGLMPDRQLRGHAPGELRIVPGVAIAGFGAGAHGAAGRRGALAGDARRSPSTAPRAARPCCCRCSAASAGLPPRFREVPHDEVLARGSGHDGRAGDRRRRVRGRRALPARLDLGARGATLPACRSSTRSGRAGPAPSARTTSRCCREPARRARRRAARSRAAGPRRTAAIRPSYESYLHHNIRYRAGRRGAVGRWPRSSIARRRPSLLPRSRALLRRRPRRHAVTIAKTARRCPCHAAGGRAAAVASTRCSPTPPPARACASRTPCACTHEAPTLELGAAADRPPPALHGDGVVTYIIDRNVNYTNVCVTRCKFCNFYRPPDQQDEGYMLSRDELAQKLQETVDLGGVQILLQGGLNPELPLT